MDYPGLPITRQLLFSLFKNSSFLEIDFDNEQTFRDLSKPIGALNKHRL